MKYLGYILMLLALEVLTPEYVRACDPCALSNLSRLQGLLAETFNLSISEQYTEYDRTDGSEEDEVGEFVKGFSTTNFSAGYDLSAEFGVQLTLPFIVRRFDDVKESGAKTETDEGIGDLILSGSFSPINYRGTEWTVIAGLTGGVKFPTGDSGAIEEVSAEENTEAHADEPTEDEDEQMHQHVHSSVHEKILLRNHPIGGASGGRALTFGSGSYDYLTGLYLLTRFKRYLVLTNAQYTIRTEGDFDYEFADDLLWSVASGYYLFLQDNASVAGLISFSGESKGRDHLEGESVAGSKVSNLYLGPQILLTMNDQIAAELGVDFRVSSEDEGAMVVPDARIRAGISFRF